MLDRATKVQRAAQVKTVLFNTGGNILSIGQSGGWSWEIDICDPHGNDAIAASGDYQRYFKMAYLLDSTETSKVGDFDQVF